MFELFVMSLREYWDESEDAELSYEGSVKELQEVLSTHYEREVSWEEPEVDAAQKNEEISVDVIDDIQLASLHLVAAKLELDGNLDGLEFSVEEPWDCEVFDRLDDKLNADTDSDEEPELEHYPHILSIGNSLECIGLPVDLPFVAQVNMTPGDGCCEDHDCDGDCECGCCDDEGIDITSTKALRRELDEIGKALKIDPKFDIDSDNLQFEEDDDFQHAKVAWYILSAKVNDAIQQKLPLIIRFSEDEYEDIQ